MTRELIDTGRKIYNALADSESRHIFRQRMLYSLTGDIRTLMGITIDASCASSTGIDAEKFVERLAGSINQSIIVFGAGFWGKRIAKLLIRQGIDIACFYDNSAQNYPDGLLGKPVLMLPASGIGFDGLLVIASIYTKQILHQLISAGYDEDKLLWPMEELQVVDFDNEYFDPKIITFGEGEVFVDGGCFDFDTSLKFLNHCPTASKIYAFECDPRQIRLCRDNIEKCSFRNIEFYPLGLWSSAAELSLDQEHGSGQIADEGVKIKTVALDRVISTKVTFIKLDIEGAELEALHGARRVITECRPKLAICVYHKPEDIITIPAYIMELVPDYNLYLRHYSSNQYDTVLYAV